MSSLVGFLQSHSSQTVGYQLPKPLKLLFRTATVSALVFSSQLVENGKCCRVKLIICFKIIHVLTTFKEKSLGKRSRKQGFADKICVNLELKSF